MFQGPYPRLVLQLSAASAEVSATEILPKSESKGGQCAHSSTEETPIPSVSPHDTLANNNANSGPDARAEDDAVVALEGEIMSQGGEGGQREPHPEAAVCIFTRLRAEESVDFIEAHCGVPFREKPYEIVIYLNSVWWFI